MNSIALVNPVQATTAWNTIYEQEVKPGTLAGKRYRLSVRPETRRDAQNAHFHAQIGDISDQIGGDLADKEDAKRILLSAFRIDTINDPDLRDDWRKFGDIRMGRGLRGEVVLMGNQTRDLTVRLASAFVEWLSAFAVEHGVVFKTPKSWGDRYER